MSNISDVDLDAIIAQRAEARSDTDGEYTFEFDASLLGFTSETVTKNEGEIWAFTFVGRRWVARDPQFLTDAEQVELEQINSVQDVAAWYLGDSQYDEFTEAGGQAYIFNQAIQAYSQKLVDTQAGKATPRNRSSRRSARKR